MALGTHLSELVESLGELVASHIALARLEFKADARFYGIRLGVMAALSPLILVGYGFLCVALALTLRRYMEPEFAFLAVGLANLAVAVGGIVIAGRQLAQRVPLEGTTEELQTTSLALRARREAP